VPKVSAAPTWQRALVLLTGTVVGVVLVATLYWARLVFIPVALAIFLTFLLTPAVKSFQKRGLGRVPSVIAVVVLAGLFLGGLGWLVAWQTTRLLDDLPTYAANIKDKVKTLRKLGSGGAVERLVTMLERVASELESEALQERRAADGDEPAGGAEPSAAQSRTLFVQPQKSSWLTSFPSYLGSLLEGAGGLALALVLVVFMLLTREDMRDRFISLVGSGRMSFTTKAVDDAAQRISRYLVMQAVINVSYGLTLALGLFLLRVDYFYLWGILAAVLRYVPYIGPWVAAMFPITLSLAMSQGWWQPLLVIGLFVVLELVSNNVMEPWLFGHSIGVSQVALLIVAAFWAFLWGPIGLVLSAPLTVCLVVLGKHVPQLAFLDTLLGDKPALDADVGYYQRLLARDQDDATHLVLARVKAKPPEQVYDDLLLPALHYARRDHVRDELTDADEKFVQQATREILEDLGERQAATTLAEAEEPSQEGTKPPAPSVVRILGSPARDESDRLALEMLRQVLDPARWAMEVTAVEAQTEALAARVAEEGPVLVCIGSLPPGGLAHTRYLCKRLRARSPNVKIMVGRWGLKGDDAKQNEAQLREAGADAVTTTLLETRDQLNALFPNLANEPATSSAVGASSRGQLAAIRPRPEVVLAAAGG
jgi:predicted PurR-regulated permease PerM/CheY-like chemotaxis protein